MNTNYVFLLQKTEKETFYNYQCTMVLALSKMLLLFYIIMVKNKDLHLQICATKILEEFKKIIHNWPGLHKATAQQLCAS
jgi:hypothetical protein